MFFNLRRLFEKVLVGVGEEIYFVIEHSVLIQSRLLKNQRMWNYV